MVIERFNILGSESFNYFGKGWTHLLFCWKWDIQLFRFGQDSSHVLLEVRDTLMVLGLGRTQHTFSLKWDIQVFWYRQGSSQVLLEVRYKSIFVWAELPSGSVWNERYSNSGIWRTFLQALLEVRGTNIVVWQDSTQLVLEGRHIARTLDFFC